MNGFKRMIDEHLESFYDFGYHNWVETVIDSLSDDFYNENEGWCENIDGQMDIWLNILHIRDIEPEKAAIMIERGFRLYKLYL